jgi:hypothetical protein
VCLIGDNKAYEDANNENKADNEKTEHRVLPCFPFKSEIIFYAMPNEQVKPKNGLCRNRSGSSQRCTSA